MRQRASASAGIGYALRLLVGLAAALASAACTAVPDPSLASPSKAPASISADEAPTRAPLTSPPPWVLLRAECFGRLPTIVGTPGPDRLRGTPGRDVIRADDGDDVVTDLTSTDRVCTGGGDDVVRAAAGAEVSQVDLGSGDDRFRGASDLLRGGSGDDRLFGTSWRVEPGPGEDLVVMSQPREPTEAGCLHYPRMRRGITADLARGWVRGQGTDRLRGVRCLYGTVHADRILGSPFGDTLYGCEASYRGVDKHRNVVIAGAGNDEVGGCEGPDRLVLGDGHDTGIGGDGADWIVGEAGDDHVWGVEGSDHLEGGDGDDQVSGTYYCDTASSAGTGMGDDAPNQVYGGNGDDEVTGDLAADLLDGGPGDDFGYGGPRRSPGADRIISVERITSCP